MASGLQGDRARPDTVSEVLDIVLTSRLRKVSGLLIFDRTLGSCDGTALSEGAEPIFARSRG